MSIVIAMKSRSWPRFENFIPIDSSYCKMHVIMNLVHLLSQISRPRHENSLLCDIDYSYSS